MQALPIDLWLFMTFFHILYSFCRNKTFVIMWFQSRYIWIFHHFLSKIGSIHILRRYIFTFTLIIYFVIWYFILYFSSASFLFLVVTESFNHIPYLSWFNYLRMISLKKNPEWLFCWLPNCCKCNNHSSLMLKLKYLLFSKDE